MWVEALEYAKKYGLKRGQYFHNDGSVCLVGAVALGAFGGNIEVARRHTVGLESQIGLFLTKWLGNSVKRYIHPAFWFDKVASDEDALLFLKHMAAEEELEKGLGDA